MNAGNKRQQEEMGKFIHIWERRAKIVGVLHGDKAAVILQTIRGNLECIYPRKLVLASIINALVQVQQRFRDALLMVRRHRIDFNIIVDHCGWKTFLSSAPEFESLNRVRCAIRKENTAEGVYKDHLTFPARIEDARGLRSGDSCGKVSSVLQAIRKAVEQVPESPPRELCILTTSTKRPSCS